MQYNGARSVCDDVGLVDYNLPGNMIAKDNNIQQGSIDHDGHSVDQNFKGFSKD